MQLRFALLTVTSSQRDLHPQVCAHAGRTKRKARLKKPGFECGGGEDEDRTHDLYIANVALSQLSYPPARVRSLATNQTFGANAGRAAVNC